MMEFLLFQHLLPFKKLVRLGFLDFPGTFNSKMPYDNLVCISTKNKLKEIGRIRVFLETFCFTASLSQICLTRNDISLCVVFLCFTDTLIQTNVPLSSCYLQHIEELKCPSGQKPWELPLRKLKDTTGTKVGRRKVEGKAQNTWILILIPNQVHHAGNMIFLNLNSS